MRIIEALNAGWEFRYETVGSEWTDVALPHTVVEVPYNGFDEAVFQIESRYRRQVTIAPEWIGRRIALHFEGVMTACSVLVNGEHAGEHRGGFTAFDVDISALVVPGDGNRVEVLVDSRERDDIPPFGNVIDYLTFGGIYREVHLVVTDPLHVAAARIIAVEPRPDASVATPDALPDAAGLPTTGAPAAEPLVAAVTVRVTVAGSPDSRATVRLTMRPVDAADDVVSVEAPLAASPDTRAIGAPDRYANETPTRVVDIAVPARRWAAWSPSSPTRYDATVDVWTHSPDGPTLRDRYDFRTGIRTAEFRPDGFYLNGRRHALIGLNRHQSFPYVGYAMPWRAQHRDADILRFELGVDVVRASHYPQSRHFLDRCDEIGLMVVDEIPGWQHVGENTAWRAQVVADVRDMIETNGHHPSVILWGVRINESRDDHELYAQTNALARSLDPLRQTGGVRYFGGSELLEDVYTYNDFQHDGRRAPIAPPRRIARASVPYLITEHNGHMFPTKRFDQEQRLEEHALRHARVMNAARGTRGVSGAIGWCAFDYNTHREFGSGDRICYHGVSDMFRIPKFAAAVYASQQDPARRVVMEPLSRFALGERNEATQLPFFIFTNCDFVRIERNGERVGDYHPDRRTFPHLPHPPVHVRELIGTRLQRYRLAPRIEARVRRILAEVYATGSFNVSRWNRLRLAWWLVVRAGLSRGDAATLVQRAASGWGDGVQRYRLTGYVGGQPVVAREYGPAVPSRLVARADDAALASGDWDTTRIVVRLEDADGNLCPFVNEWVEFAVEGPGAIIGPSRTALIGGTIAAWVRTSGAAGTMTVHVRGGRFAAPAVSIAVR